MSISNPNIAKIDAVTAKITDLPSPVPSWIALLVMNGSSESRQKNLMRERI